jgi:hypothetical protein
MRGGSLASLTVVHFAVARRTLVEPLDVCGTCGLASAAATGPNDVLFEGLANTRRASDGFFFSARRIAPAFPLHRRITESRRPPQPV